MTTSAPTPTPPFAALRATPKVDVVVALILAVVLAGSVAIVGSGTGTQPLLGMALSFVEVAALAWRRSRPTVTAMIVAVCAVCHLLAGYFLLPADIAVIIALYSVTAYQTRRRSRVWLIVAIAGAALMAVAMSVSLGTSTPRVFGLIAFFFIGASTFALAGWAAGLVRRARLLNAETLAERAHRLERERDQQAMIATQAERTRIAREMHDIVAHSLSVVIAQADGGRYAAATDPHAATKALTTISETGRAALADMRRILGVLRSDGSDVSTVTPQPSDNDVRSLITSLRDTLPVSLIEMGQPRALPPGTGATLYRIAQEALTNVLKHGGPEAKATVLQEWHPHRVILQIDDDGRGASASSDGAGHGVLGMSERASMLGGSLTAGPRAGGGFRVRADIPIAGLTTADAPLRPATPFQPEQRTP